MDIRLIFAVGITVTLALIYYMVKYEKEIDKMDYKMFKQWIRDFVSYPVCPHCRRMDMMLDFARVLFLIAIVLIGNKLIDATQGEVESQCCVAYKNIADILSGEVGYVGQRGDKAKDLRETIAGLPTINLKNRSIFTPAANTTEPATTTTTIPCPTYDVCEPAPECPTCPTNNLDLPTKKYILNYRISDAAPCVQLGGARAVKDFITLFHLKNSSDNYLNAPKFDKTVNNAGCVLNSTYYWFIKTRYKGHNSFNMSQAEWVIENNGTQYIAKHANG